MPRMSIVSAIAILIATFASVVIPQTTVADGSGYDPNFNLTWVRTDYPVLNQNAVRTWIWGPKAIEKQRTEAYVDSPGGERTVVYFDKSRMEITNPSGDRNSIWFVTNGLLVVELMTGNLQLGDAVFEQHSRAVVNVAGDADDPNGPTYTTMSLVLNNAPRSDGSVITERIDRAGNLTNDPSLASYNVQATVFVPETNHRVAGPFWNFMNSSGEIFDLNANTFVPNAKLFESPFFATGFPITEAYWTNVLVGGQSKLVLVQCFQRRCLTFTPSNSPEWQVEAGNVGLHYREWRYVQIPAEGGNDPNKPIPPTPPIREVLYQSNMTDWATGVVEGGEASYQDNAYRVRVDNDDWLVWSLQPGFDPSQPNFNPFDNASISMEVRMLTKAPTLQDACIRFRQDPNDSVPRYVFCIDQDGKTQARYDNWDNDGKYVPDILMEKRLRAGTNAATDWNRLTVVMDGKDFWFLVNGTPVGKAEHSGASTGIFGLDVTKGYAPGSPTVFEFRNVEVRALDSTSNSNGVPPAGETLLQSSLSDWPVFDGEGARVFFTGGTYHLQVTNQNVFLDMHSASSDYGDISVKVDTRMVAGSDGATEGCVIARGEAINYSHAYTLCITGAGETFGIYEGFDAEGAYFNEVLMDQTVRAGTKAPGEWNTLEIVTKGNKVWFLVNGTVQGSATHNGPVQGTVGIVVANYTASSAEFEFTNLLVRSV